MEVLLICGGVLAPNGIYFVNYDITQILELKKRKANLIGTDANTHRFINFSNICV
jgi:hypothetical protein